MSRDLILDGFAGPGGWDEGAKALGLSTIGIEWDMAACQTAMKAGHLRIRADVAQFPLDHLKDRVAGLIMSPPCQAWSMAGNRKGELDRENCHTLAERMAEGDDSLDWTAWEDERSPLVCQPIRYVRELRPTWIALEQVPPVLSLWEHFALILRRWGYSVWTGVLNAADYGVPQTRQRCILTASLDRRAEPPAPTHSATPAGDDLFGNAGLEPWVSMAEALGWGATARPVPTITGGGTATGGAEPIARGGRAALLTEAGGAVGSTAYRLHRGAGVTERYGDRPDHPIDEPAPVITSKARTASWVTK